MKCSNKNCSNDAMASKNPIQLNLGQVACCEHCKEQTELQNIHEEEHDYFDRCKGLDLEFEVKDHSGIGIKEELKNISEPTYTTLTKDKLDNWVANITSDEKGVYNT